MPEATSPIIPLGSSVTDDGYWQFLVWAPRAVDLKLFCEKSSKPLPLEAQQAGYFYLKSPISAFQEPDLRYGYLLDDEGPFPDPATRSQPDGVHRLSQTFDVNRFQWKTKAWQCPHLSEMIFYELHVGTFSERGTFEGISEKLDHLKELGITTVELMPISQFPGERNWGYDGVHPFCAQNSYGGPRALQTLVDTCHAKGLAVCLDVVYNHFGPEGNYLEKFGYYFTDRYHTPWGNAVNFDSAYSNEVRRFFIESALGWFRDFRIDCLRLDAVHAIFDNSAYTFMEELSRNCKALEKSSGSRAILVAESDSNDPRLVLPETEGGKCLDGQWMDEFHHALHVALTKERSGYYIDFASSKQTAKAIDRGVVHEGGFSVFRNHNHGRSYDSVSPSQLVVCCQNHDQVGNRMLGERLSALSNFEQLKLAAGTTILSRFLPLLFMGEEYGETNPFQFFVHHSDKELVEAVRRGRVAEFKSFSWLGSAPDPQSPEVFQKAKLQWNLLRHPKHLSLLSFYKELISIRKECKALLVNGETNLISGEAAQESVIVDLRSDERQQVVICSNFSEKEANVANPAAVSVYKLIASSDPAWSGPQELALELAPGQSLKLPGHSFAVYSSWHTESLAAPDNSASQDTNS